MEQSKKNFQYAGTACIINVGLSFILLLGFFLDFKENILQIIKVLNLSLMIYILFSLKNLLNSLDFKKADIYIFIVMGLDLALVCIQIFTLIKAFSEPTGIIYMANILIGFFLLVLAVKLLRLPFFLYGYIKPLSYFLMALAFLSIIQIFNTISLLFSILWYIFLGLIFFRASRGDQNLEREPKISTGVQVFAVLIIVIGLGISGIAKGVRYFIDRIENMSILVEDLKSGQAVLIAEEGLHAHPRFSHDGKNILFHYFIKSGDDKKGVIKMYSLTDKKETTILEDDHSNIYPTPHPLGRSILYRSTRDDQVDLFIFDMKNKIKKRLTHDPGEESEMSYSPDGQWILFLQKDENKKQNIYIMPARGGKKKRLTDVQSLLEKVEYPVLLPYSGDIAYHSFNSIVLMDRQGNVKDEILLEGLSNLKALIPHPTQPGILIIAAREAKGTSFKFNLYLLSRKNLKYAPWKIDRSFFEFDYSLSPDGKLLVYSRSK
ncbi:MAG: PD40 domain-containing protein [Spirochaetes bacterium]|nr:PD40 domain-containing protein [Spirochaetota bacterium]